MKLHTSIHRAGRRNRRRHGAAGLTALVWAVAAAPAGAACPGAADEPTAGSRDRAAQAVACVINEQRTLRELPPLRRQAGLADAAGRHADDMVRRRYFSHVTLGGRGLADRLRGSYISGRRAWWVGETLAWGTSAKSTPESIVGAWLDSPPHRRVILSPRYRELGVGVAFGVPLSDARGATFAADLGARR